MSKQDKRKSPDPLPSPISSERELTHHDYILAGIDPAKEAALVRKTRERAKKDHGFSEGELDKLYGVRSRGNAVKAGVK